LRNISILSAKGVSRAQLADSLDLVERGRIKTMVEDVYSLDRAAEAHEQVEAGRSMGRLVLKPN
jgi:D-arabinose 1-dehydrogenase-like Zn-dependent alcohol dehydrogenase